MSLDALKILQEYSDRMVQTVYDKDFEAHKNGFHIPFTLISTEGDITMYSREQLRFVRLCSRIVCGTLEFDDNPPRSGRNTHFGHPAFG